MSSEALSLIDQLKGAAHDQLMAARTLDADALNEATERRSALQEALADTEGLERDQIRSLLDALEDNDTRLARLIQASQRVLSRLHGEPPVYDRHGRMRGVI